MTPLVPKPRPALVAVCDVLGFKGQLERLGVHRLAGELWQLVLAQREEENAQRFRIRSTSPGPPKVEHQSDEVYSVLFSDSLVIWTFDVGGWGARHLFGQLPRLCVEGLTRGLPVRGAVAFGDAVIEDQDRGVLAVGDPIAWAAGLEKNQEWAGIGIHPSCTGLGIWHTLLDDGLVRRYPVPLKALHEPVYWAIDWVQYLLPQQKADAEALFGMWPEGCAETKRRNTLAFAGWCRRMIGDT